MTVYWLFMLIYLSFIIYFCLFSFSDFYKQKFFPLSLQTYSFHCVWNNKTDWLVSTAFQRVKGYFYVHRVANCIHVYISVLLFNIFFFEQFRSILSHNFPVKSFLNIFISPIDDIITGITNSGCSEPGSILLWTGTSYSSNLMDKSLTIRSSLLSYKKKPFKEVLPSAEIYM